MNRKYDDYDYMADTWDAMTDGMYGDMPDGFDGDFDFMGLFQILEKYNLSFLAKERIENTPLIFAGGPVITSNPEPFADFFDFMIIGDGEHIADEISSTYLKHRNKTKIEILKELSKINGVYVYKWKYTLTKSPGMTCD